MFTCDLHHFNNINIYRFIFKPVLFCQKSIFKKLSVMFTCNLHYFNNINLYIYVQKRVIILAIKNNS